MLSKFQRVQFYFVVSGLKIIGHGTPPPPDNNLKSHFIHR
jgi:hypothetical protein